MQVTAVYCSSRSLVEQSVVKTLSPFFLVFCDVRFYQSTRINFYDYDEQYDKIQVELCIIGYVVHDVRVRELHHCRTKCPTK